MSVGMCETLQLTHVINTMHDYRVIHPFMLQATIIFCTGLDKSHTATYTFKSALEIYTQYST